MTITYCIQNIAISSSAQESHDARLKKLEGMTISTYHLLCLLLYFFFLFAAENNALRMTLAMKEHVTTMIPRPQKGVAGNGFNLQDAMGLADDGETYNLLRVSPTSMRTYLSLMIVACCTGPISQSRARLCSSVAPPTQRTYQQDYWSRMCPSLLLFTFYTSYLPT